MFKTGFINSINNRYQSNRAIKKHVASLINTTHIKLVSNKSVGFAQ